MGLYRGTVYWHRSGAIQSLIQADWSYLLGEGQGMPGGPNEDRDAAGQKGFSEALAGLRVAGHDEAEGAVGHLLDQ